MVAQQKRRQKRLMEVTSTTFENAEEMIEAARQEQRALSMMVEQAKKERGMSEAMHSTLMQIHENADKLVAAVEKDIADMCEERKAADAAVDRTEACRNCAISAVEKLQEGVTAAQAALSNIQDERAGLSAVAPTAPMSPLSPLGPCPLSPWTFPPAPAIAGPAGGAAAAVDAIFERAQGRLTFPQNAENAQVDARGKRTTQTMAARHGS